MWPLSLWKFISSSQSTKAILNLDSLMGLANSLPVSCLDSDPTKDKTQWPSGTLWVDMNSWNQLFCLLFNQQWICLILFFPPFISPSCLLRYSLIRWTRNCPGKTGNQFAIHFEIRLDFLLVSWTRGAKLITFSEVLLWILSLTDFVLAKISIIFFMKTRTKSVHLCSSRIYFVLHFGHCSACGI